MTETHHCVLAHARARPGCLDDLVDLFAPLIENAREQAACKRFELWQDAINPRHVTVLQEWESEEAMAAYLETPLMRTLGYRLGDLVEGPPLVTHYRRVL